MVRMCIANSTKLSMDLRPILSTPAQLAVLMHEMYMSECSEKSSTGVGVVGLGR